MIDWLELSVSNAILATLLAIVVAGVARLARHPQVAHALWLLVLLKLITPPLVPLGLFAAIEPPPIQKSFQYSTSLPATEKELTRTTPRPTSLPSEPHIQAPPTSSPAWPHKLGAIRQTARQFAGTVAAVWAVGSILWLTIALARIRRFHRLAHSLPPAEAACQQEVAGLAARLGLARWPEVRIAPGVISPLLWAVGRRPLIVLPGQLIEQFDANEKRALLAHELSHYYRRDHWVRWFELLVLAVCWWHPVAWWARRELARAEEQCCDAWSVWLLEDPRVYGRALVATISFLDDRASRSVLGASAMGRFHNTQRRFEMFLKQPVRRILSWNHWMLIIALAIVTLPWSIRTVSGYVDTWARLSPFTEVKVEGEEVQVEFEGARYGLVSIDDITTPKLLAAARQHYGELWEKRFVEDLVEVMENAGKRPGETVKLELIDWKNKQKKTVERAPMKRENRQKIYAARYARVAAAPRFADDERAIQSLIKEFVKAAAQNDRAAFARTLSPNATNPNREMHYFDDTRKTLEFATQLSEVRSLLPVGPDNAIAVTDFFQPELRAGGRGPMVCVVYHCVRENGRWLIHDIDAEDVNGLVKEVGRGVAKAVATAPPAPLPAAK